MYHRLRSKFPISGFYYSDLFTCIRTCYTVCTYRVTPTPTRTKYLPLQAFRELRHCLNTSSTIYTEQYLHDCCVLLHHKFHRTKSFLCLLTLIKVQEPFQHWLSVFDATQITWEPFQTKANPIFYCLVISGTQACSHSDNCCASAGHLYTDITVTFPNTCCKIESVF